MLKKLILLVAVLLVTLPAMAQDHQQDLAQLPGSVPNTTKQAYSQSLQSKKRTSKKAAKAKQAAVDEQTRLDNEKQAKDKEESDHQIAEANNNRKIIGLIIFIASIGAVILLIVIIKKMTNSGNTLSSTLDINRSNNNKVLENVSILPARQELRRLQSKPILQLKAARSNANILVGMAVDGIPILSVPRPAILPATETLENRFEIHSTTTDRIYGIAQNKRTRSWSCLCPGWITQRHCKHLIALSLPINEQPGEVHFEVLDTIESQSRQTSPPELNDGPLDIDLSTTIPQEFVIIDIETTGLFKAADDIIEIGAIRVHCASLDNAQISTFQTLVKPNKHIPRKIVQLTSITQDMINQEGESLETALTEFVAFVQNLPMIGYNTNFDMRFLQDAAKRYNIMLTNKFSDALPMVRRAWPGLPSYKLSNIVKDDTFLKWCQAQSLSDEGTHRALGDCKRTLLIYIAAAEKLNLTWEKQVSNKNL